MKLSLNTNLRGIIDDYEMDLRNILRSIGNHTLTSQIICGILSIRGSPSLSDVKDLFEGEISKTVIGKDQYGNLTTVSNRLKELFSISGLSKESIDLLMRLSLFTLDDDPLQFISDLVQYEKNEFYQIRAGKWVEITYGNQRGGLRITMHPLIREAIRSQTRPSVVKCQGLFNGINRLFIGPSDRVNLPIRDYSIKKFSSISMVLTDYEFSFEDEPCLNYTVEQIKQFGNYCYDMERYTKALPLYSSALRYYNNNGPNEKEG